MLAPLPDDKEALVEDAPMPKVRAGFLIAVLATTVVLMNLFFVGVAFYLGVDVIPENERNSSSISNVVLEGEKKSPVPNESGK